MNLKNTAQRQVSKQHSNGTSEEEASQSDEGKQVQEEVGKDEKDIAGGIGIMQKEQYVGGNGGAERQ